MIVLRKKRILLVLMCVIVSVCCINISGNLNNQVAVPTVSLPVSNKVIVLDAGHGSPDGGAESATGVHEDDINLAITLKVQALLEQSGATVILTRSDENGIYDLDKETLREKKISDVKNRVKIGNESSADIFISIHLNKIPQSQYWGWQTFYRKDDAESKKIADSIQNSLKTTIQRENDRVALGIDNIYIVKNVTIPIGVVECGFLSNPEEEQLLQQEEYQDKLAWGIYTGIMDYFYN